MLICSKRKGNLISRALSVFCMREGRPYFPAMPPQICRQRKDLVSAESFAASAHVKPSDPAEIATINKQQKRPYQPSAPDQTTVRWRLTGSRCSSIIRLTIDLEDEMRARVATARILPGQAEELAKRLNEQAIPAYQKQPGFAGAMVFIDRDSQKAIMLTLWQSQSALDASESNVVHRAQLDDVREILDVTFYEVASKV